MTIKKMKLTKKRSKSIKIVEFFGLPGTGKTYLTNELSLKNKDKQKYFHTIDVYGKYSFVRKSRKVLSLWVYLFNINLFIKVIKIINFFPNMKFSKKIKMLFNFLLIFSVVLKKKNYKEIFFDQGIFQSLYSCFFYSNNISLSASDKKALEKLILKITKKLMIGKFEINQVVTSDDVIRNRIKYRTNKGTSPINKLDTETYLQCKISISKVLELFQAFESKIFLIQRVNN